MGYFSNGSEGEDYVCRHCASCAHWDDGGCAVWAIQIFHNYDRDSPAEDIINMLIPRSADRLGNERCTMWIAKKAE
ncbi:MAG TPA: hypothetical protein PLJ34_09570 [Hyphomicrobiales bacterium]|nr:hypothetical protein [Kaistiaceae bacterium]HQF31681.1 hypothetical protein [Hyphomicrobiales bacterium]